MINRPHQTAVYALRQIKPFEKADLVIRRRLDVEEYKISFNKEKQETSLGLVVGEKPLPFDQVMLKIFITNVIIKISYQQEQEMLGVTVLKIHPDSLSSRDGLLHVGDVIDKV